MSEYRQLPPGTRVRPSAEAIESHVFGRKHDARLGTVRGPGREPQLILVKWDGVRRGNDSCHVKFIEEAIEAEAPPGSVAEKIRALETEARRLMAEADALRPFLPIVPRPPRPRRAPPPENDQRALATKRDKRIAQPGVGRGGGQLLSVRQLPPAAPTPPPQVRRIDLPDNLAAFALAKKLTAHSYRRRSPGAGDGPWRPGQFDVTRVGDHCLLRVFEREDDVAEDLA